MSTKSTSSEELLSPLEGINIQEQNSSATSTNEEQNVQRDRKRYSEAFRNWRVLKKLNPLKFISPIHMIMASSGNNAALIVTKDKMVYGLGDNRSGRLGIGNMRKTSHPKKVKALCGKTIKAFYNPVLDCDLYCYMFALTEEGEVYSWGFNENHRLGHGLHSPATIYIYTPTKVASLNEKRIIDFTCSTQHSLALTDNGKVYTWGGIEYEELFNHPSDGLPWQVKFQLKGKKIVGIACGELFNMAFTDNGNVYSWGINNYGQLGIGNCEKQTDPCIIASLLDVTIVKVVCGSEHSLALTTEGKIYSWGNNKDGQLGHGKNTKIKTNPVMLNVPHMGKVADIITQCNEQSVAVAEDGCVYVWGWGLLIKGVVWIPSSTKYSTIYDALKYNVPYIINDDRTEDELNILKDLKTVFDNRLTIDLTISHQKAIDFEMHKDFLKIRC